MTIIAARYTDETNIPINATLDTSQEINMPSYPSGTHYDAQMDSFLTLGGIILDYDPYFGMTLDQVKEIGYSAVDEEEASRVNDAQHNPSIGNVLSDSNTIRANNKRDNLAKKKNNGISDADDHLLDHIDDLDDYGDNQRDVVEACGDNACIQTVIDNISTAPWPTWSPI
jgi:hypothetical protein